MLDSRSLTVGIQSCHSWEFTLADRRRANVVGNDGLVTGTYVRCKIVPGTKCTSDRTVFVKLAEGEIVDTEKAEEEVSEEKDQGTAATDVPVKVKFFEGWRVSYRESCPEDFSKNEAKVRRRLQKKRRAMLPVKGALPRAVRRRRMRLSGNNATAKKRESEYFRKLRLKAP